MEDADTSKKRPKPAKPAYGASEYMEHLAMAQITLEDREKHLRILDTYSKQKNTKPERQDILVLEFDTRSEAMRHVLVPLGSNSEFPELLSIMTKLSGMKYKLHNMRLVATQPVTDQTDLEKMPPKQASKELHKKEQAILSRAVAVQPLENVRMHLRLIEFFIQHRFRDAAYIAADNTKKQLALLADDGNTADEVIRKHTQDLEALETRMREVMPFRL